jgi:hypothetical protein
MVDCSDYNSPNCPKGLSFDEIIEEDNLHLIFVGCWCVYCREGPVLVKKVKKGEITESEQYFGQNSVVDGMKKYVEKNKSNNPVQALILAGDNVYARNPTPEELQKGDFKKLKTALYDMDQQFKKGFEQCMMNVNVPQYLMAIGNHDITTCAILNAQLNYPNWTMPAVYYNYIYKTATTTVNFVFIDTNIYDGEDCNGNPYPEDARLIQKEWIKNTIVKGQCTWNIVIGHNPIISSRPYGKKSPRIETNMRADMIEIKSYVKSMNLDIQCYMCADEHNQQYLTCENPDLPILIIAGSGGTNLDENVDTTALQHCTKYYKSTHGFVALDINSYTMKITFFSCKDFFTQQSFTVNIGV